MSLLNKWFAGEDSQGYWIGVVEGRQDPLELGRVQVRIYGVHNPSLTEIPSADLPWAQVIQDTSGKAFSTPKESDLVFGVWLDGSKQLPLVIGVVPGVEGNAPSTGSGFHDLRSQATIAIAPKTPVSRVYNTDGSGITIHEANTADPKVLESLRHPNADELNEPSIPNVGRYQNLANTVIQARKSNLDKNIPTANGGTWSEPYPAYNPLYPYDVVTQTESGHVFELDDTPGFERIHLAHRSGSFVEYYPTGTKVEKVTKSNYSIVMADDYVHIMGRCFITVDSDASILVKGDVNLEVGGNLGANAAGNMNFSVGGGFNVAAKSVNLVASGDASVIGATAHLTASGEADVTGSTVNVDASSGLNLLAGGTAAMTGASVGISGSVQINGLTSVNQGAPTASGGSGGTAAGIPGAIAALTKNTGEALPEEVPVPIRIDLVSLDPVTGSAYVQQQFLVTTANNTMTTPDANTANINTNPCMYDPTTKTFLPSSSWSLGANGTTLIQSAEGFAKVTSPDIATAYPDPATGGEPITIGYGSTAVAIDQPVTLGEMISRETAQSLLVYAVNKKFLPTLKATITVQLTQNMVDSLLSLIYNIGPNNFTKSTLRKRINEQNWCAAGDSFLVWNKAGGKVLPGLTARRMKERNLFLS